MSTCSSCGAEIDWYLTRKGKSIPIDPDPVPDGNLFFHGSVIHYAKHPPAPGEERYKSHFATCPNAKHHRRKRT